MGTEVADAVTVVRDQAQALLSSINQLIGVVNEPEIQQALIDVRDGLQRVVDKFNETGMRDIDSLIEIVSELRDITDKLTAALQELQGRLGTSDGTVSDLADELEVSNSLSTIYKTLDEVIKAMDNVPGLMNQFSVALGSYSSQQLSAYMQFTEAREKLKDYENQAGRRQAALRGDQGKGPCQRRCGQAAGHQDPRPAHLRPELLDACRLRRR